MLDPLRPDPKISIIIPAYNAQDFLSATIESILGQTEPDWELIVVNDGSTDGTGEIADRYAGGDPRIRSIHQPNMGLPATRNQGFGQADPRSEFVMFLDADDTLTQDALSLLLTALNERPDAVAAHGLARSIDSQGCPMDRCDMPRFFATRRKALCGGRMYDWPLDQPTTLENLSIKNCIATAGTVLIRRSVIEKAGLFDTMPLLPRASCEDWDYWIRLSQHGDFIPVHRVTLGYRRHGGNLSHAAHLMFQGDVYVMHKLTQSGVLRPAETAQARKRFWRFVVKYTRQMAVELSAEAGDRFARLQIARGVRALRQAIRVGVLSLRLRASYRYASEFPRWLFGLPARAVCRDWD